jgi:hypothetical protein
MAEDENLDPRARLAAKEILEDYAIRQAAHDGGNYEQYKLQLKLSMSEDGMSGPVVYSSSSKGAPYTDEQLAQAREYAAKANIALDEGLLSPTGRVSTAGKLKVDSNTAARREKNLAAQEGRPYAGEAGHTPDTTWLGYPEPPFWTDQSTTVNRGMGAAAKHYPVGYKPTIFIMDVDVP